MAEIVVKPIPSPREPASSLSNNNSTTLDAQDSCEVSDTRNGEEEYGADNEGHGDEEEAAQDNVDEENEFPDPSSLLPILQDLLYRKGSISTS